jgi:predicted MFS family arabinose efflux permease
VARRLVVGEALAWLFFTVPLPVTVVFARETLGASDAGYGVMVGCWGAGALVGSALFARARAVPLATLIVVSTAAIGVAYGVIAVSPTLALACIGSAIGGLGNGMQWVSVMTALQEVVGDEYQARAAGLLEAATDAIPAVGFAVGGAAAALISPRLAFAIAAAGTLVMMMTWIRRPLVPPQVIRPGPALDEEPEPVG